LNKIANVESSKIKKVVSLIRVPSHPSKIQGDGNSDGELVSNAGTVKRNPEFEDGFPGGGNS
jgi:hypothetical protein